MTFDKIPVCIQGFAPEEQSQIAGLLETTQRTDLKLCLERYCEVEDDEATQRILDAQPEIVLVDMHNERAAIKSLFVLHSVIPAAWLFACSDRKDPQLIIETMQMGAREYLAKPISADNLGVALNRCIEAKERIKRESRFRGKIYVVTAAKGGAGATSVAVNLAATLANAKEARVALFDMNSPAGDVASYMGVQPQFSLSDALESASRLDPMLLDTYMTTSHGLWIMPGPQQLRADQAFTQGSVAKLLHVASQTFTHIFIDTPSSMDPELLRVVADSSEAVLVVFTPELPSLWRTYRLIAQLNSIGSGERTKLVLNRASSRSYLDEREIRKSLNQPIYFRLPNDYRNSIHAVNKGKPVISMNHSRLASDYQRLIQNLAGIHASKPHRRFLRFFDR
jgi:pilus assembly protein CpaE